MQFAYLDRDGRQDMAAYVGDWTPVNLATPDFFGNNHFWFPVPDDPTPPKAAPRYWATIQYADVATGDGGVEEQCLRTVAGIQCGSLTSTPGIATHKLWDGAGFFSDANGFDRSSQWETIQFPDVDGSSGADVCGRAANGLHCALSNGKDAFQLVTRWTAAFGDADPTPWATDISYWSTIQFPDLDGDGKQDVCGRARDGLRCARSTGSRFEDPTVWAAQFSDDNGWKDRKYAFSIQFQDLNGDGAADVCARGGEGLLCGLSNRESGFDRWQKVDAFRSPEWDLERHFSTFAMPLLVTGNCRPAKRVSQFRRPAARIPF